MTTPSDSPDDATPVSPDSVDPHSIEGIFVHALQRAAGPERRQFLVEACGDDQTLQRRVEALLSAYDDSGSFLERPAVQRERTLDLSFLTPSDDAQCLGMLGPYAIHETLGRGGMGVVLLGRDAKLARPVAIKVLVPELASRPDARRRFLREARAAAAVSHPHIVTIHAVEDCEAGPNNSPHPPYLVMEYVAGQSLQQKIDRSGALAFDEVVRIGRQIADGLAAAHRQGLTHRDIKPANVLLENGVERAKITDFGLARAIDDVTVTRTGELSGTPQYMSPEQASGGPIDQRSDLFSLGCVLYAMAVGHSPFRANGIAHAIQRVTQETPRPLREIIPEIPAWFEQLLARLLEKNPEHRIQQASEVVACLDAHATAAPRSSAESTPAPPTHESESLHARVGRHLIQAGVVLVTMATALIATGFIVRDGDPMQLGGEILMVAAFATPALLGVGYVLRYIVERDEANRTPMSLRAPIVMAALGAVVGGALHAYLDHRDLPELASKTSESNAETPAAPIKLAEVPDPYPARLSIEHPDWKWRSISVNGLGSMTHMSPGRTTVMFERSLLGANARVNLVLMDGREYMLFHPVEWSESTIKISEEDVDHYSATFALVEVIDDVAELQLRAVNFPCDWHANRRRSVTDSPFHALLRPIQRHEIRITCLPADAPEFPEVDDYRHFQTKVEVRDATPQRILLSDVVKRLR
ncbi:MAG: serine/threonine protein kinase [Planctomycetales bacterium]|nr:serine/threonine protein kinase [Planctomycetales bacterium]